MNQNGSIFIAGILCLGAIMSCNIKKLSSKNISRPNINETFENRIASKDSLEFVIEQGKQLFLGNCAACHNINLHEDLIGPALSGVRYRWSDFPKEDLYNWIRDSQEMIKKGHPKALDLWYKWEGSLMNSYPSFTDSAIESILIFIENN